jgi:hypothetical protein
MPLYLYTPVQFEAVALESIEYDSSQEARLSFQGHHECRAENRLLALLI